MRTSQSINFHHSNARILLAWVVKRMHQVAVSLADGLWAHTSSPLRKGHFTLTNLEARQRPAHVLGQGRLHVAARDRLWTWLADLWQHVHLYSRSPVLQRRRKWLGRRLYSLGRCCRPTWLGLFLDALPGRCDRALYSIVLYLQGIQALWRGDGDQEAGPWHETHTYLEYNWDFQV